MRNSDVLARVAAVIELMSVLFNLLLAFVWFISLIWVLVGVLWGLLGLVALVEAGIAVFILVRGASPLGIAGPVIGLVVSLCNFNFFLGVGAEVIVLCLLIGALVMRSNEDKELAANG